MKKVLVFGLCLTLAGGFASATEPTVACAEIDRVARAEGLPWWERDSQLREAGCPSIAREMRVARAVAHIKHCEALEEKIDREGPWDKKNGILAEAGCSRLK